MAEEWSTAAYRLFKEHDVRQVSYVPDAGLTELIKRCDADNELATIVCTTEEEGVAITAGAWLGGQKGVCLMQSSGVGNTINMIASLIRACHFPFLTIVTMRGDHGESNPWQNTMGGATPAVFEALGVRVFRADNDADAASAIEAGLKMAFHADLPVAVLIGQKLIGAKAFIADAAKEAGEEIGHV